MGKTGPRNNTIKCSQFVMRNKCRTTKCVPAINIEVFCAMKVQVHPRNGRGREVLLLSKYFPEAGVFITFVLYMISGLN